MTKQLLVLVSMIALAVLTVPSHAQVLKGSKEATNSATTARQAKATKATASAATHSANAETAKTQQHIKMHNSAAGAHVTTTNPHTRVKTNATKATTAKDTVKQ